MSDIPIDLRTALGDDAAMAAWRKALQESPLGEPVWQLSDHQVVEGLRATAWSLAGTGRPPVSLHALGAPLSAAGASSGAPPAASGGAGAGRSAAAGGAPPPPPEPVPGALASDIDAEAMAQTLRDAARDGTPFCEECAREAVEA